MSIVIPSSGKRFSSRLANHALTRLVLLLFIIFLMGLGASVAYYLQQRAIPTRQTATVELSTETKAVLGRLDQPVELRFYSLLDTATVAPETQAYVQHLNQVLSAYEQAGNGKIRVLRFSTNSTAAANAALADRVQPFNRDKGDVSYFGIAVSQNSRSETLPHLSPTWKQALEPDITRAIDRVSTLGTATLPVSSSSPELAHVENSVREAMPDLDAISVEEAAQRVRDSAFKEFSMAVAEGDAAIKAVEERIKAAFSSPEQAGAARQELQQLKAAQTEQMKKIAAEAQAAIEAVKRIKGNARGQ